MSYGIVYATCFLRSNIGITPCVLSGSSNVYETSRRRSRSWAVFNRLIGVSPEELEAEVEGLCQLGGEHWMANGAWVGNKEIINWFRHNLRDAQTVEEVLEANHLRSLYCGVTGGSGGNPCQSRSVKTTEEFDEWITEFIRSGADGYPYVDFGISNVRKLKADKDAAEEVFLKYRGKYLVKADETGSSWNADPTKATKYSRMDANKTIKSASLGSWVASAAVVSAKSVLEKKQAVIRLKDGSYVYKLTSARMFHTASRESAKKYSSIAAAKRAAELISKRFPSHSPPIVEPVANNKDKEDA